MKNFSLGFRCIIVGHYFCATMSSAKTQDLPPPGGYDKIRFMRVPARSYLNGFQTIGAYLGMTAFGAYVYYLTYKMVKREEIEMRSAKLAIMPVLIAERDREYLKQIRRNRDEEAKLMKNVPGWVVGTWYGEPLYKTKPKDYLDEGTWDDLTIHASNWDNTIRTNFHMWN